MKRCLFFLLFLRLSSLQAQDASNQNFDSLLKSYREGFRNYALMPYLANTAKALKQHDLADSIARDYIDHYLFNSTEDIVYKKSNIEFLRKFNQTAESKAFDLFYKNGDKIDRAMGRPGYAKEYVDYIIAKQEIDPRLWQNSDPGKPVSDYPNWKKIKRIVQKKYGRSYADRTVLNAQLRWYNYKKDWNGIVKYNVKKIEQYGLDTTSALGKAMLNNMVFEIIFKHSNDKAILRKATGWMEMVVKSTNDPIDIDTYANLLYKLGRRNEAVLWEQKAVTLAPSDKEISDNMSKMKRGVPTWPVE